MSLRFKQYWAPVIYLICVRIVTSFSTSHKTNTHFMDPTGEDIANYMSSKIYIPNEKQLPKAPLIKNTAENDATYLLTRLSDEELLKMLNEQPQRNEFTLNDIVKLAFNVRPNQENKIEYQESNNKNPIELNQSIKSNEVKALPYYRLDQKPVDVHKGRNDANYLALQKLKYLLNDDQSYQPSRGEYKNDEDNNEKKQLIFDTLVAQLKSLCCKEPKNLAPNKRPHKALVDEILPSFLKDNAIKSVNHQPIEYMFLIMNDEIKSASSDELTPVDPDSLDGKSSILLLGPVTTPLSDNQLKLVMKRISKELAKPEYMSLLQQLSDGVLVYNNKNFMKNFVFGPETRRYIKPHRCNHQSKLARVYGGPKWLICTGYLNINKPSLYD